MRFGPDRPWLPFTAEELFPGNGIDFRWHARVRLAPLISARVVDSFENGVGMLTAQLLGFLPGPKSRGPATDKSEAMRGLAELPWRPSAFNRNDFLIWEETEQQRLRATFDDGRTQAAIEFAVDGNGHVLAGKAPSRSRMLGKTLVQMPWSGTFDEYKVFDRLRVPTVAEASWHLPEGSFTYWRARVTDFRILR